MRRISWLVPTVCITFVMLPIYWLLNMSFKTTNEILGALTLWPENFTTENYVKIFTDPTWYMGYVNSLLYVSLNTTLSVAVALPAAYAFSRYRFTGDKHLFFWLLTNRMAPPAVFALPFFQLYSAIELFDTHIAVALARRRAAPWRPRPQHDARRPAVHFAARQRLHLSRLAGADGNAAMGAPWHLARPCGRRVSLGLKRAGPAGRPPRAAIPRAKIPPLPLAPLFDMIREHGP